MQLTFPPPVVLIIIIFPHCVAYYIPPKGSFPPNAVTVPSYPIIQANLLYATASVLESVKFIVQILILL